MKEIWARVGATIKITKQEETVIFGDFTDIEKGKIIANIFKEGRYELDGETYIPQCCVEDFNSQYGTEYKETDIDLIV